MKQSKLYLITFVGVIFSVLLFGYFGVTVALNYMQKKYINIQLDVNKRQAEGMAKILQSRLEQGVSKENVIRDFQTAIEGTHADKGFMCMYGNDSMKLVCHPDKNMVGMKFPVSFTFENSSDGQTEEWNKVLETAQSHGGLFNREDGETDIVFMTPIDGLGTMLLVHENIATIRKEIDYQRKIFRIGFLILGVFTALLATFMARLVGRRYEKTIEEQNRKLAEANEELKQQKEEISTQKDEIEFQNIEITNQKIKVEHQHEQITASIRYAQRIQNALLPVEGNFDKIFREHFVFFLPKDIVSGDFYWYKKVGKFVIFAAVDCTGHGVPGAFMSMLGISYFNEILNDYSKEIHKLTGDVFLNNLKNKVIQSLRQDEVHAETRDGMDLSLIIIDTETLEMQFAAAFNSMFVIRNKELIELEADRMPVGIHIREEKSFSVQKMQLQKNDRLYLFSDGFEDQFGGKHNRKYMIKQMRTFLLSISEKQMSEQKENVIKEYHMWKGNHEQIDDVLVAGFLI